MKTPEGKIVAKIFNYLSKNRWWTNNLTEVSLSGTPDLIAFKDGRYVWIEVKTPEGRLSPIQKHRHKEMIMLGMEVFTVRSLDELKERL